MSWNRRLPPSKDTTPPTSAELRRNRILSSVAIAGFVAATGAILFAPLLVGVDYDWVARSVSESAAQQTPGSWLGRLGLALSGLSVLVVCVVRAPRWGPAATISMSLFGLFWVLTAVYSTESWRPETARDQLESTLHSVFASAMAIVILGGLSLLISRRIATRPWQLATVGLIAAATFLPLASVLLPGLGGVFQRLMFVVAYAWFMREAARSFTSR